MSKQEPPQRIWIRLPYGRHPDDWNFTDGPEIAGSDHLEYVPAAALRELEAENERLTDVLIRSGFTPCSVPACNCGSWHQTGGFKARFDEIEEATNDYWRNGETLLARVQRIVAELEGK